MDTKLTSLTGVVAGLQSIIYPIHFDNLSLSVLSKSLYDMGLHNSIGSPICGVLKNETPMEVLSDQPDILVIDLDQAEITLPKNISAEKIVLAKYQEYFDTLKPFCKIENIRKLFSRKKKLYKFDLFRIKEIVKAIMDLNQRIFIDPIDSVLITKTNTDEKGKAGSQFDKKAYRELFEESEKSFIDGLLDNISFINFTTTLCMQKSQMIIPDLIVSHTPTYHDFQLGH